MPFDRTDRISGEVRRELDRIIREEMHDPRIAGTYSLTHVEVTRDLRYAKVRVSVLEEDKREPMLKALKSGAGFMRRALSLSLSLRYTPELIFELDRNMEYGAHIADVLKQVMPGQPSPEDGPDDKP